jgi:signal transduction histidine kinase/DNA-binding LytR/AlgR family response regulator
MLSVSEMTAARPVAARTPDDLCVLVVEDSEADAYLIHRALFNHPSVGQVVHAHDGLEAQEMIERGQVRPDVAFIDLQMPRLNGFDLLIALASGERCDFPMVVLTSSSLEADRLRSRIRGAVRVITKPNSVEQLGAMLTVAIDAVCAGETTCGAARRPMGTSHKAMYQDIALSVSSLHAEGRARSSVRAAAALRSASRIAQVGGWEMDFTSELTSFSPELCELLGGSQPREMPISDSLMLWVAADRPAFVAALDQVIASGAPLMFEGRSMAPDGSVKWWRMLGEADFADDRCVALRGAAQDVTKWRASEARERAATLTAAAMLSFLGRMSHEIRTPLNGVLGMTQVMAAGRLSGTQREHLEVIARSGGALLTLFEDLLDLSKLASGELELQGGGVGAQDLADGAQVAFGQCAEDKGLEFRLSLAPGALGRWTGDAKRLGQVIQKLVSNAVKFTDQGSVSVEIARPGKELVITVSDTGIGIAADRLPHIFERFVQADSSTTRRHGGSGAGLTICRELLALMGGRISVESVEGEGTVVTVTLPVARAETSDAAGPSRATTGEARALHVLVAEDNAVNQLVLKTLLSGVGIHPVIVENGQEALEAWRDGDWDIVLMDIQMPVMDGVSAANSIRRAERETGRRRTPIVAVTASSTPQHSGKYLAAEMDGLVAKPVDLTLLLGTMDGALTETARGRPFKAPSGQRGSPTAARRARQ